MTKLAAALPKGDGDGLHSLDGALVSNPMKVHVVLALVDCKKITTDNDSGDVEPTVRIRSIEPITTAADKAAAEKMLRRALEQRTGATELPFELDSDIKAAFGDSTLTIRRIGKDEGEDN